MRSVLLTISIILAVTATFADAAPLDINDLIFRTGASSDGGKLTVVIDQNTGDLSILNTSGATLGFGAYSMFSTTPNGGNLDPAANVANVNPQAPFTGNGLNSIQQQAAADYSAVIADLGAQALAFEVVSATTREITETWGTAVLQSGASLSFGSPLQPGTNNDSSNFAFMYAWQNPSGDLEVLYSEIVTTPEPTTLGLVLFGAIGLIARSRRRHSY